MKRSLPPDTRHEPVYQNELTLEVIYSQSKWYRAVITRDANVRFRVRREKWDVGTNKSTGQGCWLPIGAGTVTASLEIARSLVDEELEQVP